MISSPSADIGLIGLAVMGQNLILNMNDHGFVVCAFNRTTSKVDDFLKNEAKGIYNSSRYQDRRCSFDARTLCQIEATPKIDDVGQGRSSG
jgi:6-phosphogluconate dehydrogenase (decarboxylating)